MEGVGAKPGAKLVSGAFTTDTFFWGENLMGVQETPIRLTEQSKLVYSPHIFGPSVHSHEYFMDHKYPNNLEDVWHRHFGYVLRTTGQPLIIGTSAKHPCLF